MPTIEEQTTNVLNEAATQVAAKVRVALLDHKVTFSTIEPRIREMLDKGLDHDTAVNYAIGHLGRLIIKS